MTHTETDWTTAPLTELIDHIVSVHHDYLKREMPRITGLLAAAMPHAETREIRRVWRAFVEEMEAHLWKEEQILFPMVRALCDGRAAAASHCGGVQNPLRVMVMEHDSADRALQALHRITSGYRVPTDRPDLGVLYLALDQLSQDVYTHMHKENDILFPRVLER